jgi:hypothetical protein
MGASQEIKLKIGGDTASLERSFSKLPAMAEAAGRKAESAWNRSARFGARQKLESFREKQTYDNASTIGKIKITTEQLSDLAYARNKTEKGTTAYLQQQLAIEQKLVTLRSLQKQAQKERAAGVQMPGANEGGGGGEIATQGGKGAGVGGAIRSIALSAATGLVAAMTSFFERRNVRSQQSEDLTGSNLASTRNTIASIGGMKGELKAGRDELKGLIVDIDITEKALKDLTTGTYAEGNNLINPLWKTQVDEIAAKLTKLKERQTELGNNNDLVARKIEHNNALIATQARGVGYTKKGTKPGDLGEIVVTGEAGSIPETAKAKAKGGFNSVRAAIIEGRRLMGVLKAEESFGTPESAAEARLAVKKQRGELASATRETQARQQEVAQTLSAEAAGGRTFADGSRRPRSETERLAQRAENYRQRARAGVLTGAAGVASFYQNAALETEQTVAGRLARGSSLNAGPKGAEDLTGIKPELTNANKLLGAIKDALTSEKVD